jgi:hypothetical protein
VRARFVEIVEADMPWTIAMRRQRRVSLDKEMLQDVIRRADLVFGPSNRSSRRAPMAIVAGEAPSP